MGGVVSALARNLLLPHHRRIQMQQQLCKDDNKKVVHMGGILLAIGSSILSSLLLLFPFRHKKKKQQQQHNDNNPLNKLWRLAHQYPFRQKNQKKKKKKKNVVVDQQQKIQKIENKIVVLAGGILSALVASLLNSSLALLPHHRRRIQHKHNDNSRQILKIVVVDKQSRQPSQISLLEIGQGDEDATLYTINYGPRGIIPLVCCHGMFLSKTHQNPLRLAIWNPTTSNNNNNNKKLMMAIPQSSVPRPPRVEYETVQTYGFGFDPPSSNDYKVIKFLRFDFEDGTHSLLVELYSLKTNSWKQVAYPHGDVGYRTDLVCLNTNNGFCYARASGARLFFIPFDLANDSFPPALIPGPPDTRRSSFAPLVFEGSQLAVIAYQYVPFQFELWVWNDDESCWSLRGAWAIDDGIGYSPHGQFLNNGLLFLYNSRDELVLFDCAKQRILKTLGVYGSLVCVLPCID